MTKPEVVRLCPDRITTTLMFIFGDILDCSFLDDAVVLHLTSKCLPSDHGVSPPALSLPMRMRIDEYDSRSFIYDLDNGLTSQIAVLSAVAKRLQWKSIGFVTDGSGGTNI